MSLSVFGVVSPCALALAVGHGEESHNSDTIEETKDHCDSEEEKSLEELVRIVYPTTTVLVENISKLEIKLEKETFPKSFFIPQKYNRSNEPPQEVLVFIRTVQLVI